MPEAEDVLLDAAARVSAATRALWSRNLAPADTTNSDWAAARRRIGRWLVACFGRGWPLVPVDPPTSPGWLARGLGTLAPWARVPMAVAGTDGSHIQLPRVATDAAADDARLLAALGLGVRLGRGLALDTSSCPSRSALHWCVGAARADRALERALPGLAPRLGAARADALARRPALAGLRPAERLIEELVRELLARPLGASAPSAARAWDRLEQLPAEERARCRGVAPVAHWGIRLKPSPARAPGASGGTPRPAASRRLPRRVERRVLDAAARDPRPGPFVLPFSDPQLAVQDAAGLERPPDQGEEEDLDALADELARQNELAVVRSEEPVRELLEAEPDARSAGAEPSRQDPPDSGAWRYPEWDHRIQAHRAGACTLREAPARGADPHWAEGVRERRARLLERLQRRFEALRPRRVRIPRQLDGDDLDIDAWVDEFAERSAGRTGAGRLYSQDRNRRRDVSALLLIDASGSTDAWVSGSARVIDVARETALCFGDALAALGDRYALHAFSGQGAHDVRVWVAKDFAEPAGPVPDARLAALAPDAFTRLGAPLRHATARLLREPSHQRLLLLFSDGKPNDEDLYEGEYGVEDVRQAVVEARAVGVRVFCITIDREGADYLPRLFGPSGYTVVRDVAQLPERLPEIYRHLTAR